MAHMNRRSSLFGRVWVDDDTAATEDQPLDSSTGLASLGYIRGAVRRGVLVWGTLALFGLLLGAGATVVRPPGYQASTTLVLKVGPEAAPGTAIQNEQIVAQSIPVAALALKKLKLAEDVSTFMKSYTVTVLTDQALVITVDAPSSDAAVTQAGALASAFLLFRQNELQAMQNSYFAYLDKTISQQKQLITSLDSRIAQAKAQPASPGRSAALSQLRDQRTQAISALATMQQSFSSEKASSQQIMGQQVNQSKVVNPAAPVLQSRHARLKRLILDTAIGLLAGLVIGLGIVIVRALVSDRMRRREDVAYALGAPVRLSVGAVVPRRWRPGRRGLDALRGRDIQRIAAHVRRALRHAPGRTATLALVSVDSSQSASLCIVALALSCVDQGQRVVIADLVPGRPAARLIDTSEPGVRMVELNGHQLMVAVPQPDDDAPVGPLDKTSLHDNPALVKAARSADLLLTLVVLDPALGGDHLATWATEAVVMVTAGRSSWTKINAVGEMIRLSGTRVVSAILVGADKADESLGVTQMPVGRDTEMASETLQADTEGSLAAVSRRFPLDLDRGEGQPDVR
jgi:capsular polysaccharide biosynthesis protein